MPCRVLHHRTFMFYVKGALNLNVQLRGRRVWHLKSTLKFRASHFLNLYSTRDEAKHFVSKCSEPARLKKRSLFEQASMLHNSRNIRDRRIAQSGFYQLVPTRGGKREPVQIIRVRGPTCCICFVFLGSIIRNLVDRRPSCV